MGKPEASVEKYLVTQAKNSSFLCFKFVAPGITGVPDRILVGHGHVVFIELKKPGGKTSARQDYIIAKLQEHGADVRVIDNRSRIDDMLYELFNSCTLTNHDHDLS